MINLERSAVSPTAARRLATLTPDPSQRRGGAIVMEGLLAGVIVVALGFALWRFHQIGYLPQPFLYDLNYPLMGLYDTAYWANHSGAYDLGKSFYPPLSFVFLRLVTIHSCYGMSAFGGRDCDWLARVVIFGFYGLNVGLVYRCFRNLDTRTALWRALAVCVGLPMLYALECTNLIIVSFTFFVLGYGGLIRSAPLRWLTLGLSINFKPYLLVLLVPPLLRRQWRWSIGCVAVGSLIYLLTYVMQAGGSPSQLISNLRVYAADIPHQYWNDVYYGTSYWPLVNLMSSQYQFLRFSSPHSGDTWRLIFISLIRAAQLGSAVCLVIAAFRPARVNVHRFAAMILAVILTTITTGQSGYVQIFLFFLIFFEPWRGPVRIVVLVSTYLLSIPADYALQAVVHAPAWSYLGGRQVEAEFGLSVGQLLRPAVLLIIQFGLIVMNLSDLLGRGDFVADQGSIDRVHGSASPVRRAGPASTDDGAGARTSEVPVSGWTAIVRAAKPWVRAHETKARFLAAGGVNTAFGLAIFPALMWMLGPRGLHYMTALVIAQMASISFAYLTQKFLVFRTKGNVIPEFYRFSLFYLSYFVVNLAVLPFSVEIVHIRPIVAQFFFSLVVVVTSYFWHSRITFKTQKLGH